MQGTKRERKEIDLYVGFAQERVVAMCPNNEEMRDTLNFEIEETAEEPKYVGEKEGVQTARIDVWLETMGAESYRHKRSFFLENKEVKTKEKEDDPDYIPKFQFVNQTGDTFYADAEENLPEWFTNFQKNTSKTDKTKITYGKKQVRVALVGEADLMQFVRNWLSEFDYWNADTNILLDMDAIFSGDFRELQDQVGGEMEGTVTHLLGVKTSEKDGEIREYQDVYSTTLPGYSMKLINNAKYDDETISELRKARKDKNNPNGRYLKDHEQIALDVTDKAYPWKSFTVLAPMRKYNPEDNFVQSEASVSHEPEDASY